MDKWVVFGGSWGSTLSLIYAINHPDKVLQLVLRGIFMGRKSEIDWLYSKGASELFPEQHEKFLEPLTIKEREDVIPSYYNHLTSEDESTRLKAARAWAIWEGSISKLHPPENVDEEYGDAKFALGFSRMSATFINNCFIEDITF